VGELTPKVRPFTAVKLSAESLEVLEQLHRQTGLSRSRILDHMLVELKKFGLERIVWPSK